VSTTSYLTAIGGFRNADWLPVHFVMLSISPIPPSFSYFLMQELISISREQVNGTGAAHWDTQLRGSISP